MSPDWAPPPPAETRRRRLYYWCHTTSRLPFETGIQRVTRRLARALRRLGVELVPVGYEDRQRLVEVIGQGPAAFEAALAAEVEPPLLFVPENAVGVDPVNLGRAYGLRTVALVHDLIPVKLRTDYDAGAVGLYEDYYASLARADAVLATTRLVADDLRRYLEGRALPVPPLQVIPLPAQFGDTPRLTRAKPARAADAPLRLVTVASWEPRKNLLRLLRALARAREALGGAIALTLVGRRGMFPDFDREVEAMLASGSGATARGTLDDAALAGLVAQCDATVYPSWEEGFGLPVGESLWLGCPCLCHNGSAMAEVAPGGGTMMVDMRDETAIADALVALATRPALVAALTEAATSRTLAAWDDYADEVAGALGLLARRQDGET